MKLVNQSFFIRREFNGIEMLKDIEFYARIAYKSNSLITDTSYENLLRQVVLKNHHESIIEHEKITVLVTTNRAIANELVRHRISSYTQESTRYCNFSKGKFNNEITCVIPEYSHNLQEIQYLSTYKYDLNIVNVLTKAEMLFLDGCISAENTYFQLLENGCKPETARDSLPLALATTIVVTNNLRSWRHFFEMRCAKNAHPQMRVFALKLLNYFHSKLPIIFDDFFELYKDEIDYF